MKIEDYRIEIIDKDFTVMIDITLEDFNFLKDIKNLFIDWQNLPQEFKNIFDFDGGKYNNLSEVLYDNDYIFEGVTYFIQEVPWVVLTFKDWRNESNNN